MEKSIEDYLHLYLGCKVETDRGPGTLSLVTDGTMGCAGDWTVILDKDSEILNESESQWIKLRLRPMTDITAGELMEMEKISLKFIPEHNQAAVTDLMRETALAGIHKHGMNAIVFDENTPPRMVFALTDYWLSKYFDLFGLIESDLAINSTLTNNKTTQ